MVQTDVQILSTPEFEASIEALRPKVAVFDCDGTLWSGDAGSSFMWWSMETGLLNDEASARLRERYDAYRRGEVNELLICGEMVQIYQGLPVTELRDAAARFFAEHIEPNIFPEMLKVVDTLQREKTEVWAVSSTSDWVIEEGVKRFGIAPERVLAACVHCEDGVATGKLRDVPTDAGKVEALRRHGITRPDVVFGNSVHDAAMLGIARQAYPINPTPALVERSVREGWPVYYPASVRPAKA